MEEVGGGPGEGGKSDKLKIGQIIFVRLPTSHLEGGLAPVAGLLLQEEGEDQGLGAGHHVLACLSSATRRPPGATRLIDWRSRKYMLRWEMD